jgi:hypothetical protein
VTLNVARVLICRRPYTFEASPVVINGIYV